MSGTGVIEIAGGGIAGLTAAAAFARRGWEVHVHERTDERYKEGAGIFLGENGVRALYSIGGESALDHAEHIKRWEIRDHRDRVLYGGGGLPRSPQLLSRTDLHAALVDAAVREGVDVITGSEIVSADPSGELTLADGTTRKADLVIAADGVYSKVRDSLGTAQVRKIEICGMREWLPYEVPNVPRGTMLEYWRGVRRIGFGNVGAEGGTSVYFSCPSEDVQQMVSSDDWFELREWSKTFPHLTELMEGLAQHKPTLRALLEVYLPKWVYGRAVVIGDAAHSIAPTFAQGGCLAMQDAVTLADMVGSPDRRLSDSEIATTLNEWERLVRPMADKTQRYTRMFSRMSLRWPNRLADVRSAVLWSRRKIASELMDGRMLPDVPVMQASI